MMEIDTRPPGSGRRSAPGQKVIDFVRARQRDAGARAYFDNYHEENEHWRMVLCSDGLVYLELLRDGKPTGQVSLDAKDMDDFRRAFLKMQFAQRRLHEHRRGAHLWIARPHPDRPGCLLVKHRDQEVHFRPIRCGAPRRARATVDGKPWTKKCDACAKPFEPGEYAFEAERSVFVGVAHIRARICKGCTQPPREGLELINEKPDALPPPEETAP
jgi:hypothetical protein